MKKILIAFAIFGTIFASSAASTSCFGPPDDDGGTPLDEQTACVGGLITQADTPTYYDVYVDIKGTDGAQPSYIVLAEGVGGWDVLPGDLKSALFIADIRAKNANKPVRTVFGPGLADDLQQFDASIKLDTSSTYYTLIATGCVERKPALHHEASETDCIPEGATECRVSLQYQCAIDTSADASTQDPLDVSFAHYPPPGTDASAAASSADGGDLAADTCLGIAGSGVYMSALPISNICQCGVTSDQIAANLSNASSLIDTALEVRGMDTATAEALVATMLAHAEVFQGLSQPLN